MQIAGLVSSIVLAATVLLAAAHVASWCLPESMRRCALALLRKAAAIDARRAEKDREIREQLAHATGSGIPTFYITPITLEALFQRSASVQQKGEA